MKGTRKRLGQAGEEIAARELLRRGYTIRERNWRCAAGELDLVTEHGRILAFVEVRTRRGSGFGLPEESITRAKAGRLVRLVDAFRQVRSGDFPPDSRIDVVAIVLDGQDRVVDIKLIQNAVEGV